MSTIANNLQIVIVTLASFATIISAIIAIVTQPRTNKAKRNSKSRSRTLDIILFIIGIVLILIASYLGFFDNTPGSLFGDNPEEILYYFYNDNPNDVASVAWSPDSLRVATAGLNDGTIQVWDALTGQHPLIYQPPTIEVNSLSWSPDGRYIAANVSQQLYILALGTTTLYRASVLNSVPLSKGNNVVAWSPSGTQIAAACSDNSVRIWNISAGKINIQQKPLISTFHSQNVYALSWSPDGQYIASASTWVEPH